MVTLTNKEWADIYNRLAQDWPASHLLIREVTRRELGFTVRRHSGYRPRTAQELDDYDRSDNRWHETERDRKFHRENIQKDVICLDFYDDVKETWFRLRYLDRE